VQPVILISFEPIDTVIPSPGVLVLIATVVQLYCKGTPQRVNVPEREPSAVIGVLAGERYG
jgi:hypothetical protein